MPTFTGTSNYGGNAARQREWVAKIIKGVYADFGVEPLETPIIVPQEVLDATNAGETATRIFRLSLRGTSRAFMRFDHTVPLAAFVADNWNTLTFPYIRSAIGPVYRDERGTGADRESEFTQCDFDIVGEQNAPLVDAMVVAVNYEVLKALGFKLGQYTIQVNDRRLLNAIVAAMGMEAYLEDILRAWDNMAKLGRDGIRQKLAEKDVASAGIAMFDETTDFLVSLGSQDAETALTAIELRFYTAPVAEAVAGVRQIIAYIRGFDVPDQAWAFVPTLARGLAYYTGAIFEATVEGVPGSIMGGGRFDKLVADLGGPDMPACGSSFGLERLMAVMAELGLLPNLPPADVFVTVFDPGNPQLVQASINFAARVRGLTKARVRLYTGTLEKFGRQLALANKEEYPVVAIIGPDELEADKISLKRMATGEQITVLIDEAARVVEDWLEL